MYYFQNVNAIQQTIYTISRPRGFCAVFLENGRLWLGVKYGADMKTKGHNSLILYSMDFPPLSIMLSLI